MPGPKLTLSLHSMLSNACAPEGGALQEGLAEAATMTKRPFMPHHAQTVPRSQNLEAQANKAVLEGNPARTLMLRNIPNKYVQTVLLQEIDGQGFAGTYDFFYLPMDVHNRSNVGYAFINFLSTADAERFREAFSEYRFKHFRSRKVSSVCSAHVQGLDENLRHFENRAVTHSRNDQYRPIVLSGKRRVDFEVAVQEAKARLLKGARQVSSPTSTAVPSPRGVGSSSSPPSLPSDSASGGDGSSSRKGSRSSSAGSTPVDDDTAALRRSFFQGIAPRELDWTAGAAPQRARAATAPGSVGSSLDAQAGTLRKGLEEALRVFLTTLPGSEQTQGAVAARPMPPPPPPGLHQATRSAPGSGRSGNEVEQLLNLRSLLAGRLVESGDKVWGQETADMQVTMPPSEPQLWQEEPSYITVPTSLRHGVLGLDKLTQDNDQLTTRSWRFQGPGFYSLSL